MYPAIPIESMTSAVQVCITFFTLIGAMLSVLFIRHA